MAEHFLDEFLRESGGSESLSKASLFVAEPWYNPFGDCIEFQTVPDEVVANRIDNLVTIYESAIDGRPIGFQIKDVKRLIRDMQGSGFGLSTRISTEDRNILEITLSALLFAAFNDQADRTSTEIAKYGRVFERPDFLGSWVCINKDELLPA